MGDVDDAILISDSEENEADPRNAQASPIEEFSGFLSPRVEVSHVAQPSSIQEISCGLFLPGQGVYVPRSHSSRVEVSRDALPSRAQASLGVFSLRASNFQGAQSSRVEESRDAAAMSSRVLDPRGVLPSRASSIRCVQSSPEEDLRDAPAFLPRGPDFQAAVREHSRVGDPSEAFMDLDDGRVCAYLNLYKG